MFGSVIPFDCDASKRDVSRVKDMKGMFYDAESFNTDISKWGRVERDQHGNHVRSCSDVQGRHLEMGRVEGEEHEAHI